MTKFNVILNLKHNGKRYAAGDVVEIEEEKVSDGLVEAGVITTDKVETTAKEEAKEEKVETTAKSPSKKSTK